MNFDATGSKRAFIMDKRGEGVPIIISESLELSGKRPEYALIADAELRLRGLEKQDKLNIGVARDTLGTAV